MTNCFLFRIHANDFMECAEIEEFCKKNGFKFNWCTTGTKPIGAETQEKIHKSKQKRHRGRDNLQVRRWTAGELKLPKNFVIQNPEATIADIKKATGLKRSEGAIHQRLLKINIKKSELSEKKRAADLEKARLFPKEDHNGNGQTHSHPNS